jgi:hypothetical protein
LKCVCLVSCHLYTECSFQSLSYMVWVIPSTMPLVTYPCHSVTFLF